MSAKNGLWVFRAIFRGSQVKEKPIKWLLLFALTFVSQQCFSEGRSSQERDVMVKFCVSANHLWYGGEQSLRDVFIPYPCYRIDSVQGIENIGTEFYGSRADGGLFFSEGREPMGDKPSETQANAGKKPEIGSIESDAIDIHPSILVLLALIVASLFWRPNDQLKGRTAFRASRLKRKLGAPLQGQLGFLHYRYGVPRNSHQGHTSIRS